MILHVPGYTCRNIERSGHSGALVRQNILFHHFTGTSGNGCCNSVNEKFRHDIQAIYLKTVDITNKQKFLSIKNNSIN